jgi:hypothetical protein
MSKGWLIIGVVMLLAGIYLIFLANSLYYESNQIKEYTIQGANSALINKAASHISINATLLLIISFIILIIGIIMCIEWISFSRFLKKHMEK